MPRPGPRRPLVAIRLDPAEIARVDAFAQARGMNRSEAIRWLIAAALEKS